MLQMGYGLECMPNDNIPTKLFIGRLPSEATTQDLQDVFSKYGALKDVYIPPSAKGYGFVTFGSVAAAYRAMNQTHSLHGQYLNVSTANSKNKSNGANNAAGGRDSPCEGGSDSGSVDNNSSNNNKNNRGGKQQ